MKTWCTALMAAAVLVTTPAAAEGASKMRASKHTKKSATLYRAQLGPCFLLLELGDKGAATWWVVSRDAVVAKATGRFVTVAKGEGGHWMQRTIESSTIPGVRKGDRFLTQLTPNSAPGTALFLDADNGPDTLRYMKVRPDHLAEMHDAAKRRAFYDANQAWSANAGRKGKPAPWLKRLVRYYWGQPGVDPRKWPEHQGGSYSARMSQWWQMYLDMQSVPAKQRAAYKYKGPPAAAGDTTWGAMVGAFTDKPGKRATRAYRFDPNGTFTWKPLTAKGGKAGKGRWSLASPFEVLLQIEAGQLGKYRRGAKRRLSVGFDSERHLELKALPPGTSYPDELPATEFELVRDAWQKAWRPKRGKAGKTGKTGKTGKRP